MRFQAFHFTPWLMDYLLWCRREEAGYWGDSFWDRARYDRLWWLETLDEMCYHVTLKEQLSLTMIMGMAIFIPRNPKKRFRWCESWRKDWLRCWSSFSSGSNPANMEANPKVGITIADIPTFLSGYNRIASLWNELISPEMNKLWERMERLKTIGFKISIPLSSELWTLFGLNTMLETTLD